MEKYIALKEKLDGYDDEYLKKIDLIFFVYSYETAPYEGSGFGVGKIGDKYFYHEMGHCSCYGPLDRIEDSSKMLLSFEDIKKISEKSYGDYAKDVIQYITEKYENHN